MPPAAAGQLQAEQARLGAAVGGHGHQLAVLGPEPLEIIEGAGNRLPARQGRLRSAGWVLGVEQHAAQLPAALHAGGRHQLVAIPGGGAHPVHPLRHGELRLHRQQPLPWPSASGVQPLQVPPAVAVVGHHQLPVRQPQGLEDRARRRLPRSTGAGDQSRRAQASSRHHVRQPELAAVPGHVRLLPLHPGQPAAIGAEHGIAAEVEGLAQQLRFTPLQGHGHQLIKSAGLHHPDPAPPPPIDQPIGEGALPRLGEPHGRRPRLVGLKPPEAAIAIVHHHHQLSCAGSGCFPVHRHHAAAVFMDAAAQVPLAWGELDRLG